MRWLRGGGGWGGRGEGGTGLNSELSVSGTTGWVF